MVTLVESQPPNMLTNYAQSFEAENLPYRTHNEYDDINTIKLININKYC